jgi:hypothetical protein
MRVTFPHNGVCADVHLLLQQAPRTCEAIWNCLPIRTTIIHAMMTGRDALIELPPENQRFDPRSLPLENGTITPTAGDVCWFYLPQNMMRGFQDESWEVTFIYGPDARFLTTVGWMAGSVFGRIDPDHLPAFAAECAELRRTGAKAVEITALP